MINSLEERLELPNFGHMITHAIEFESRNKILVVINRATWRSLYTIPSQTPTFIPIIPFFKKKRWLKIGTSRPNLTFFTTFYSLKYFFSYFFYCRNFALGTGLIRNKLNPKTNSRNTLFSHLFNQKRVLREWRPGLSDCIHFYIILYAFI